MTPGIYSDISLDVYCADPAPEPSLSASVAHALLTQSPRHAWAKHPKLNPHYRPDESSRMDLGTIAHAILLEDDRSKICVVDANDWRTNAAKAARDEAWAAGKNAILQKDIVRVDAMVEEAKRFIAKSELADVFLSGGHGGPEKTLIWQEGGIWCRSRPDWLTYDQLIMVDFKTTSASAEPSAWGRGAMMNFGCDLQAALAIRGIRALAGIEGAQFIFFVQETDPPFACSLVGLSPAFLEFARDKLLAAMMGWRQCLESNVWPGYPSRIAWVDPPDYALYQFGQNQMRDKGVT